MIHNFKIIATYAENPKQMAMSGTIEANAVTRREAKLICDELIRKDTRIIKNIKF